ncbi:MAG: cell envelope integrity protein CreD [Candidatus Obscuribacterales bacterium]|nr:cell envelope integrity protein CreD [Candidatus Obscuribacterales bacterium]
MIKQIASLTFIYLCVCMSWMILGSTVVLRTGQQNHQLSEEVQSLWGTEQKQEAPSFYEKTCEKEHYKFFQADASDIDVKLNLEQRQKGLLWYPTYKVAFKADYLLANHNQVDKELKMRLQLPDKKGVYDNLKISIGNQAIGDFHPVDGMIEAKFVLPANSSEALHLSYDSMGVSSWRYTGGKGLSLSKNFKLSMNTNFDAIDFPDGSRSPTGAKEKTKTGWHLVWQYENTMTGNDIGMKMPQRLNPGPLVSDVTFFAPVSLFFFFYVTWLSSTIKSIKLHPMHYFFIGAAFFSFHLLLAYSVDHIPLEWSFLLCSLVSVFLVMSYVSRIVSDRKFVRQVGISQFIYLVLFSYTFFLEQFTGLIITCLSISTLFLSMQYTCKIDWTKLLAGQSQINPEADLSLIEEVYTAAP